MFGICFDRCLEDVWEIVGNCLEDVWDIFERELGDVWEICGMLFGDLWEIVGNFLGTCWIIFERFLAEVLGILEIFVKIFGRCLGHAFVLTPQQYTKKPVKIGQGLDFLKVWRGKSKKTIGKAKKTIKIKNFRV